MPHNYEAGQIAVLEGIGAVTAQDKPRRTPWWVWAGAAVATAGWFMYRRSTREAKP